MIDVIISTVKWQNARVYLDDVIIFSKTVDERLGHVEEVLRLLADATVTLKLKEGKLLTEAVEYIGHVIKPGKL